MTSQKNGLLFDQAMLIALITICGDIDFEDQTDLATRVGYYYRKDARTLKQQNNTFIQNEINRILHNKNPLTFKEKWMNHRFRTALKDEEKESIVRAAFHAYFDITHNTQISPDASQKLAEIGSGIGMTGECLAQLVGDLIKIREKMEGRIIGSSPKTTASRKRRVTNIPTVFVSPGPLLH